jgi:hypothetical protein
MIVHHDSYTPHQTKVQMKTHKERNECSMSYGDAIGLVNDYSPEALEAIEAHIHSTRPFILSLKNEIIYAKHLLRLYANTFSSSHDANMFWNLSAEQPEAFPLPTPRPHVYVSALCANLISFRTYIKSNHIGFEFTSTNSDILRL